MKKLPLLLLILLLAVSCVDSEFIEVSGTEKSNEQMSVVHADAISIDEALSALDRILAHIDLPTRGRCRKAGKITTITKERMFGVSSRVMTGIPDGDLLYVVNFENDSGYAILGANNKLDTVIMVGDSGSLDPSRIKLDSIPDAEFSAFAVSDLYCEDDDDYYIGNVMKFDPEDDITRLFVYYMIGRNDLIDGYGGNSGGDNGGGSEGGAGGDLGDLSVGSKGLKLLKTLWHQGAPFNLNFHEAPASDTDNPGRRPAGCTTIAAAQIITYRKNVDLSDKFGITSSTWQDIENVNPSALDTTMMFVKQDVASMVKQMADGIGVQYNFCGSGGTFATPTKVKKYLETLGYSVTKYLGCNNSLKSKIRSSVMRCKPVFIAGLDSDCSGHAWVIDGYYSNVDADYVHCNLGWSGASNGWYVYSVFDTTDRRVDFDEKTGNVRFKYTWWYRTLIID